MLTISAWSSIAHHSVYARCGPLVLALSSWRAQPVAWIETDDGILTLVPVGLARRVPQRAVPQLLVHPWYTERARRSRAKRFRRRNRGRAWD